MFKDPNCYFGSKRGYYVAVVEAAAAELRERTATDPADLAEGLLPGQQPLPALRAALEGWMSFLEGVSLDWLANRDLEHDAVRSLIVEALAGAVAAARAIDPTVGVDPSSVVGERPE